MDVKPISVVAIKPSVDSGSRHRPQQSFADPETNDDRPDAQPDEQAGGQMPDDAAPESSQDDVLEIDAPALAPELPAPPKPGRYVNKVV